MYLLFHTVLNGFNAIALTWNIIFHYKNLVHKFVASFAPPISVKHAVMKMRNKSGTLVQRRYPRRYARYPREKIQVPSKPKKHKHEASSSKNISRCYCATVKCPSESRFTLDVPNAPMYLPRSDISCISLYRLNESPFSSRVDVRVRRHFDEGSCRYPRTIYHCDTATIDKLLKLFTCTWIIMNIIRLIALRHFTTVARNSSQFRPLICLNHEAHRGFLYVDCRVNTRWQWNACSCCN